MDYFRILNLEREPFSNSPDPELFYQSRQHLGCLQQLELSLRLRRGLNVVIGDVGTGKTTLCRQLIRKLKDDETIETHLILDPYFSTLPEFLSAFAGMLLGRKPSSKANEFQVKESIKKRLFQKGIDEDKTVILIIDEGQKIPEFCLEILREFLNYETNDRKLLQIIIFAQTEFDKTLKAHPNFGDRISLYHFLAPLNFRDTRLMILHRINQSSSSAGSLSFFSLPSLWAIYRATGGYPRKIVTLCHRSILTMIIQNRSKAGWMLVRSCVKRVFSEKHKIGSHAGGPLLVFSIALLAAVAAFYWTYSTEPIPVAINTIESDMPEKSEKAASDSNVKTAPESELRSDETSAIVLEKAQQVSSPGGVEPSEFAEESEIAPPLMLGQVVVQRWETIGGLIQKIYGRATPQYLEQVASANPHIADPNNLAIGDVIGFPALPVSILPPATKCWWIRIDGRKTLGDAMHLIRSYPDHKGPIESIPLRLIPFWNRQDGLTIPVVFRRTYMDEESALHGLNRLPETLASSGKVVSLWDEKTVYYADPFLVKDPMEGIVERMQQ